MTNPTDGSAVPSAATDATSEEITCLVLVGAGSDVESTWGTVPLAALSEMLQSARPDLVENLDAARRWLDEAPAAKLLLVYPDPVLELARQLDLVDSGQASEIGGDPPEWSKLISLDWVGELLDLHRRHRRRIVLVNGHAALADPEGLAQQLQQRLGVVIGSSESSATSGDPSPTPSALAIAVAQAIAEADDVPGSPMAGLVASSLPLAPVPRLDIQAAMEAWRSERARAHGEAVQDQARQLAEENELLLLQLQQVQEELETYFIANRELQQPEVSAELAAHAKRLESDLQAVHASLSWKITAPLRALARPLVSKKAE